jgi:hypothetical protein
MTAVASALADGDVSQQVRADTRDEVGQLGARVRRMIEGQQALARGAGRARGGGPRRRDARRGAADVVGHAFGDLHTTLTALLEETYALVRAARAGASPNAAMPRASAGVPHARAGRERHARRGRLAR